MEDHDDPQTRRRTVQALFTQEESAHRKAPKSGDISYKAGGAAARACGSVFQTALTQKPDGHSTALAVMRDPKFLFTAVEDQGHYKILFVVEMSDEPFEQDRACVCVAFAAATKRI